MKNYYAPWMDFAMKQTGVKEIAGRRHSPTIMGWLKKLKSWVKDDETPWCGTYAAIVADSIGSPLPPKWLSARGWLNFGKEVMPQYGAWMVFWRGKKNGWQGHVGLYVGEDATHFHILGGNQSNSVNITRVAKSRFLGARWPSTAPLPRRQDIRQLTPSGRPVSTNEQ